MGLVKNIGRFLGSVGVPLDFGNQGEYHPLDADKGVKVYYSDCGSKRELEASHLLQTATDYYNSLILAGETGLTPVAYEMGTVALSTKSEFGKRNEIQSHDVGDSDIVWTVYVVMEHLTDTVRLTDADVDPKEQWDITERLVTELEKATNVIHRDPRPENVLTKDGKFWLVDL